MKLDDLLIELDENLMIQRIEKTNSILHIHCYIKHAAVNCKYCGTESKAIHSKYTRTIADLPIQNYQVKLVIILPKYFCANKNCKHKTFSYPITFADVNALRTKRLNDYIYQVGMKNSSLEAEKQISNSHVSISNNTILRVIKKKQNIS